MEVTSQQLAALKNTLLQKGFNEIPDLEITNIVVDPEGKKVMVTYKVQGEAEIEFNKKDPWNF